MSRVVLVGYGQMLYSLIKGIKSSSHEIIGVFRLDRVRYSAFNLFFKDIFNPSEDYTIIKSQNLKEINAKSVNDKNFIKKIKKLNPDMIIVGSWGEKFGKEILNTVPCINFHPALLPKNRGANPYFWTIYLNQKVTGLSVHYMNEKFDKGDILLQEAITIEENENGKTLKNKTCKLAQCMVVDLLNLYEKNQLQPIKQDEQYASYEHQISQKEVIINLNQPKNDVERHLRALYPWAKPYVEINKRYIGFENFEFLPFDAKYKNAKNHTILKRSKDFVILKGSDFLFKIYRV
jgi:methionyl-tRNA formyltransferase